jgi:hypothetical protein
MIGYLIVALALILFGAAVGFAAVVSWASTKDKKLAAPPVNRLFHGVRAANGLHVIRHPDQFREAAAHRHDLPRRVDREWR